MSLLIERVGPLHTDISKYHALSKTYANTEVSLYFPSILAQNLHYILEQCYYDRTQTNKILTTLNTNSISTLSSSFPLDTQTTPTPHTQLIPRLPRVPILSHPQKARSEYRRSPPPLFHDRTTTRGLEVPPSGQCPLIVLLRSFQPA